MKNTSTQGSDDDGASRRQEIEHLRMLSRAVDQSPALVVITGKEGNIQYVNPKFIQLTGYTFEEVLGRNPRILKSGVTPSDEYTKMWDLITSGNEWRGEFHNKKKSGELYWEFASISPIRNSQGQITHFLAVKEDITERKRLEKEILEISEREQQRIGHDLHDGLGQHLTGIAFLAKVLAQKLAAGSLPEAEEATEIASLVNQAIAKTRALAKGLCPVELEGDDLVSGLQQLAANVQNVFGVSCTSECDTSFPTPLNGAAIHLFRIAQEAVTNAVKHGNAKQILIEIANLKNQSILTVRDNGIGIPEVLDTNGGLGLHIMKYRTRVINGSLSIERDGDTGTIVRCTVYNKSQT